MNLRICKDGLKKGTTKKSFCIIQWEVLFYFAFVCPFLLLGSTERGKVVGKAIQEEVATQVGRLAKSFLRTR